ANQLTEGGALKLGAELGCVSVDHATFASDSDLAVLAEAGTVVTLLPGIEFSPASPIPTPGATSTPGCAWPSPRTATPAPGSPTACPSPSRSASGTCISPSNRRCGRQRPEVPTPCSEPTSATSGPELAPTWPSSTRRAAATWPTGPESNSSNASTPAVNSSLTIG